MKKLLFITLIGFFLFLSCKKEEEAGGYPYRFNCKINGVLWEAKYREHEGSFSRNDLDVSLINLADTASMNFITTNYAIGEGLSLLFPISDTTKITKNYISECFSAGYRTRCDESFMIDKSKTNRIDITAFDTKSKIIKGDFQFVLIPKYSKTCTDTLRVTEGYFDVKFYRD